MVIWRTTMSLALWVIWTARCDYVFNNVHIHLNTMLIEFWMLFVHTLRGHRMISRVRMMFCGNNKWPFRTDGKDSTYFRLQLLVRSGIMPYLLLCWIADSTIILLSYMTSSVWSDAYTSFCILQVTIRSEMKCLLFFLCKFFK